MLPLEKIIIGNGVSLGNKLPGAVLVAIDAALPPLHAKVLGHQLFCRILPRSLFLIRCIYMSPSFSTFCRHYASYVLLVFMCSLSIGLYTASCTGSDCQSLHILNFSKLMMQRQPLCPLW